MTRQIRLSSYLYLPMTKLAILLISLAFATVLFAQKKVNAPEAMNTCVGAVNIFDNGEFQLQFTGNKANSLLTSYPSLSSISSDNQLWCSFIAPASGEVTFNAFLPNGFVQYVVFKQEQSDICGEIENGVAEIKRVHIGRDEPSVGLDYEIGGGVLYPLEMTEGQKIHILFSTTEKLTEKLFLNWEFIPKVAAINELVTVDERTDDFAPTFSIKVRDKENNQPLFANLSIEGSKSMDALYSGSDFFFNVDRNCKLTIKCAVEGYFFVDIYDTTVNASEDLELIIPMDVVRSGKTLVIEDIEFNPGTSEITKSSEPKLLRLKDFLALNSDLKVEIQGHVFALGDNSIAGQKISEARAKRVMHYLIENGIDKSRLSSVGYGNTRPIYPEPRFSYEEQANRRVEIVIL